jgi:hypothetical protein
MPAHYQNKPDAFDHLMAFAMQLPDDSIMDIADRLLAEGIQQDISEDADHLLAGCLLRAFVSLRQAMGGGQ